MTETNIPTTHTGSLPRPERVQELVADPEAKGTDEFEAAVADAVRRAVRQQADTGLDIANDGEQGRISYSVDITNRLAGYGEETTEIAPLADLLEFPEFAESLLGEVGDAGGPIAVGPVEYVGGDELRHALDRFDQAFESESADFDRFYTAPSPGVVSDLFTASEYYDSQEDYLFALADALQEEYRIIAESQATLQVDAPELLCDFHTIFSEHSTNEAKERVSLRIDAINQALDSVDREDVRLHTCWGNYEGPHHHDIDIADVLDLLYEADISGLVVEAANPRHEHQYEAFAEQAPPEDWTIYPGVIDVKTNFIEHPKTVANRIENYAEAIGDPSRVGAGTDCGFETLAGFNQVNPDIVWKKLEALVEGADLAAQRFA